MTRLAVPQLGEGIVEVRILSLRKQPGERVAKDEVVYEMEHDKAAVEIESPADGVLTRWLVAEGDTVPIGAVVAEISAAEVAAVAKVRVPPRTRLMARRAGLADEQLPLIPAAGSVLLPEDVQRYLESQRSQELSTRQQQLNTAMRAAADKIVPAVVAMPLDAEALDQVTASLGAETAFQGFALLAARTAMAHKGFRSRHTADNKVQVHDRVDLGIAVATDSDDLTVAVVRAADQLSDEDFHAQYVQSVERARDGQSQADGTVSLILSHLGEESATFALPVVVPPAVATLFLGSIDRGSRQMVLTFDHSLINGREAAAFLAAIRDAATVSPVSADPVDLTSILAVTESVLGHAVDPDRPLGEQGMDSAAAVRLVRELGVPLATVWRHPRLRDLAAHVNAPVVESTKDAVAEVADDIAVIGMSCRVPGADDVDAFWDLVARGECRIGATSRAGVPERAGLLDRIDLFDAEFFGVTPRQAASMDPQQRMLLELSWHALEHAGVNPDALAGNDVGVFVAACSYDYREQLVATDAADGYATIGTFPAFLANRVSHFYDFTGPSITMDTACSGSLTALASAVAALRAGDCTTAMVGAANLLSNSFNTTAYQQAGMLSPAGHSHVFDASADGFVRGEGAAWVVLKPLRQALSDGDPVLAVIKGVAVNHGGRAASLTAPNPAAQTRVIRRALARAGLQGNDLGYLEAHGTGTALGDPIEIDGILGALDGSAGGGPADRLWIGSVKANLGHLEGASGLAGLIKAVQALRHNLIPATPNFTTLNPDIDLAGTPLAIAAHPMPWTGNSRYAAISSFGLGGSNAHVVIGSATSLSAVASATLTELAAPVAVASVESSELAAPAAVVSDPAELTASAFVPLSAATPEALAELASRLADVLEAGDADFAETVWTLQTGRRALRHRKVVLARSKDELVRALRSGVEDAPTELAQWLAGGDVDWAVFWPQGTPARRVPLALYPFQRKSFWLPGTQHDLHDHVVAGRRVRPGAELIDAFATTDLARIRFLRPVPVTADLVADGLTLTADGEVCATATAATEPVAAGEWPREEASTPVDLYGLLAGRGIEVGPVYRVLQRVRRSGTQAWADIVAGPGDERTRRIAWLDAALQASHAVLDDNRTYIAAGIDRLSWQRSVPARAELRVRRTGDTVIDIDVPGVLTVRGLRLLPADTVRMLVPTWQDIPAYPATPPTNTLVLHDRNTTVTGGVDIADPQLAERIAGFTDVQLLVGGAHWADDASGVAALREWLLALVTTARTLGRTGVPSTIRLVTTGLSSPTPGAALQGALLGALRSIPMELPTISIAAVDLDPSYALLAEVPSVPTGPALVSLRPEGRRRQVFVDQPVDTGVRSFKRDGVYILFGGTGGIGTEIARHLAAEYNARLVLVGRSPATVSVPGAVFHHGDVTNPADVAAVLSFCRNTFGEPDGFVHTVGSVSAALIGSLTPSEVDTVLATKVTAVQHLRQLAGDKLLVLSSSVAGLFGSQGGLNYAAANSFLGYYASAAGGHVRTLDWGLWRDTGLAKQYTDHVLRSYPGLAEYSPADGIAALETAVAGQHPHAAVIAGQPQALAAHQPQATETVSESAARRMDFYARAHLSRRMADIGLGEALTPPATFGEITERLGVVPEHHRLLAAVLDLLASDGLVNQDGGKFAGLRTFEPPSRDALLADHPDLAGHLDLLDRALASYGPVLRGEQRAADVLFPGGDLSGVTGIYSGNSLFDPVNQVAAQTVAALVADGRQSVLEIGAGVGGTTAGVLAALATPVEYVYTDLSQAFLNHGRRRFGDKISTALLNIEHDPAEQGFHGRRFDVIVASNVVHATRDLETSLTHIGRLLNPGGRLVLSEMVAPAAVYTLIFGLTDGWWRYVDPERRLPHGPLLDVPRWQRLLADHDWTLSASPTADDPGVVAVLTCAPPSPAAAVPAAPSGETVTAIADGLRDIVRTLIADPTVTIPGNVPWQQLGIDSLLNNELVAEVSSRFTPVSSTVLFEHRTVDALAAFLAAKLEPATPAATTPVVAAPIVPVAAVPVTTSGVKPVAFPQVSPLAKPAREPKAGEPIAIVGVAGRYPGAANVDEFWRLLATGGSPVREVPADRWDWRTAQGYARYGCFIDDWDGFDPEIFRISPRDAATMDPQERVFLEVAWEAFETAGYARRELSGGKVGVFAGVTGTSNILAGRDARLAGYDNPEYAVTALASVANRVSHAFDLAGPSFTVDTMCSSSLTAVHLACRALESGDADMALAGGVNLYLHPDRFAGLCALGMPSHGKHTKAFGAGGDGFVPGEGVGAIVLKRLSDAEADGDTVYAVIRGSGINHGGGTGGYTVPNPVAQAALIAETLRRSTVDPRTVDYIEAHGTGTELGDPIELRALAIAFADAQTLRVGSVKSNIGHGEAAAGIAGLTKVILQLRNGQLAPTLHAEPLNPKLELAGTPLTIQHRAEVWPAGDRPRRAAISSFGAGGANAHVIVEEYRQPVTPESTETVVVPLSAPDRTRLAETARRLAASLPLNLNDIAHTLTVGRERFTERAAIVCRTRGELIAACEALATGAPHPSLESEHESARRWLAGGEPDVTTGRRIALPTTPFARVERPAVPHRGSDLPLVQSIEVPTTRTASLTLTAGSRLLADHVVDGVALLPGAVHPELVFETLLSAKQSPYGLAIRSLAWPEPATGTPMEIKVRLDGTAFRVTANGRTAAEGTVQAVESGLRMAYDPADLERRLTGDATEFYRAFEAAGFEYGPLYRTVTGVGRAGDEVISRLALPAGEDTDGRQVLHPAMLDGACQTAAYRLLSDDPTRRYRPLGVDRITVHRPVTGGYVHARSVGQDQRRGVHTFDLRLIGADGAVLAEIDGFMVRADDRPVVGKPVAAKAKSPVAAYKLDWIPMPSTGVQVPPAGTLALGDGTVARTFGANPLPGWDDEVKPDETPRDVLVDLTTEVSTDSIFAALRALVRSRNIDGARVHVVTAADGEPAPLLYGLHGLVRTIAGETARFGIRLVTLDTHWLKADPAGAAAAIVGDEDFTGPAWVRLAPGRREVATLVPDTSTADGDAGQLLSPNGCYLLVGGAGGLGREVAASILNAQPQARVVLVGRSAQPAGLPSTVEYRSCDVTDRAAVEELARSLPDVRGIVYLAGQLRDGFLRAKTPAAVQAVCDAKILGATLIDEAFAAHRLDFFVLASSLAALAGNQGQSDYAFANGYLDGFAAARAARRPGRTLSIGWPILAGDGMSPNEDSLRYLAETLGLTPLPMADAAAELWRRLPSSGSHVALVHGNTAVWEAALGVGSSTVESDELLEWLRDRVAQSVGIAADKLDADRDLIAYGVDSVALMRLNRMLESDIGRLPMTTLLDSTTLRDLASRLRTDHADQVSGFGRRSPEPVAVERGPAPLTERLMGIWAADQLAAPQTPYNISMSWELASTVDLRRLSDAVDALVARHPALGSVVRPHGGELAFVPADQLPRLEIRDDSDIAEEADRRFRLDAEAPLRAVLHRSSNMLQLVTHHLVVDGRSAELLRDDLDALYRGAELPPVAGRFADSLHAEQAVPAERLAECAEFWKSTLAGVSGQPLFAGSADRTGAHREYTIPAYGDRSFVLLLAAFATALARKTGQRSLLISVPTYGRSSADLDNTVGCFVNSVPLRIEFDQNKSTVDFLAELREQVRGAVAHADLPYPKIAELCGDAAPTATFAFQNWRRAEDRRELLTDLVHQRGQQGHFDLGLEVTETAAGLEILANHRTAVLSGDEVDRLVDDMRKFAAELSGNAVRTVADLLDPAAGTLVGRFEAVAARTPDAVAVEDAEQRLTYRELDDLVRRVATAVTAETRPGEPVAVLLDRDVVMPGVLLGVLAAGSPYVPLDSSYPAERLALVLEGAGCKVAVVTAEQVHLLPADVTPLLVEDLGPALPNERRPAPDDLAYLMFTSGSTGKPKGVGVTHGNVIHTVDAIGARVGWTERDRLLAVTTVCFDISVLEIFLPLITGGTLVVADRTTIVDARRLASVLADRRISVMQATPAGWQLLLDGGWAGKPDLVALCGGEALPEHLAQALVSRTRRLWNVYGPTEATIWSTIAAIDPAGPVHLGDPIGGTDLVITPSGELWIGGPAVATGYWQQPDLTAQRFGPHPLRPDAGGRYFRTGDLVRLDDNGRLLFVGRADNQVKIRGHRVELGEIEAVLDAHPDVARSIVTLVGAGADVRLTATVVADPAPSLDVLRRFAETRLPAWLLPDRLVVVAAMPLTPNGKVDRKAVAAQLEVPAEPTTVVAAVSLDGVATAWAEVLGLDNPPRDRKFFDLGGNSLLLGRLYARLAALYPTAGIEVADLFARPTMADQVELISQRLGGPSAPAAPRSRRELRRAFKTVTTGDLR
ncbi:MAG TPA: amino acid adenylation domain-containing protein [Kutzneria sp.]|nr:amino acid adenylation domain-containing protein [Kutzneria sp.]